MNDLLTLQERAALRFRPLDAIFLALFVILLAFQAITYQEVDDLRQFLHQVELHR